MIFFAIVLSSLPVHLKRDGASAESNRSRRIQVAASRNLPDFDEIHGNAASEAPGREYSLSGRSPVVTQSGGIVNVSPGSNQTPNPTQSGTDIFLNMSNSGHGDNSTFVFAWEDGSQVADRTGKWFNFQAPPAGTISKITLKLNWTHVSSIGVENIGGGSCGAQTLWKVEYTINGGSNWVTLIQRPNSQFGDGNSDLSSESAEAAADIPIGTSFSQIQIRANLYAEAACLAMAINMGYTGG